MESSNKKKRLLYIDCLKGFAIILVVLGHVFDGYIKADYFADHRSVMSRGFDLIYSFHMALFFLISGFVYKKAYITAEGVAKPSLKKQILNLIVIYIVFSVAFGLFKIAAGKYTNSDVTFSDILLIWLKPIYPYWYLYVLVFYYLCFQLKVFYRHLPIAALFIFIIVSALSNLIPESAAYYFEIRNILYYAFFFYIGVVISFDGDTYQKYELPIAACTFTVSAATVLFYRAGSGFDITDPGSFLWKQKLNFIIALGISLMLLCAFRRFFSNEKHTRVRVMSFFGRYSLEIYVIHCVFTAGNRVVLSKLHIDSFYINIILNTSVSVFVPILISLVCKRMNVHKLFFRPVYYFSEKKSSE